MGLFPKVILRWKEPRVLQEAGSREAKHSLTRMISISILVSLPLIWLTHRLAPDATGRVCLAMAAVNAFMYFVFWVYKVFPSWVTVTEKGISQSVTTEDEQVWKFEAMRQCMIFTKHVGGKAVRMLVIETRRGDCSAVGIAETISIVELEAALVSKGVTVIKTDDHPSEAKWKRTPQRVR